MPTAFNVLLQTARNLEAAIDGVATANGTTTTLIDSGLIVGHENDEFNGGSLFLRNDIPADITNEAVGVAGGVGYSVLFSGSLDKPPIIPSSVTLVTPAGSVTDTEGVFSSVPISVQDIPFEEWLGDFPGNLVEGTISFTDDDDYVSVDSGGVISLQLETRVVTTTLDYETGDGSADAFLTPDEITWLANKNTVVNYSYRAITGTVNTTSGAIALRFGLPQSGNVTATYLHSLLIFVPLITRITDFDSTSGTVTFEPTGNGYATFSSAGYAIVPRRYPLYLLLQKLNEVLNEINDYVSTRVIRTSDLNNYEAELENWARVLHVWQGYDLNGNDPKRWQPVTNYTRANGVIRLEGGVRGDTVIIETVGTHPTVTALDSISDTYSLEWLALATAVKCCRWRLLQPGSDDRLITIQLNDLMAREQRAMRNRRWMPPLAVVASPTAWPEA